MAKSRTIHCVVWQAHPTSIAGKLPEQWRWHMYRASWDKVWFESPHAYRTSLKARQAARRFARTRDIEIICDEKRFGDGEE